MTVLVVDDDPHMRMLIRRILEAGGYAVQEADHGQAALDIMANAPLPDIVVTDLMMPVMSGMEFVRQLRSEPTTAALPIVAVSADTMSEAGVAVFDSVNFLLDKTSITKSLLASIRSVASAGALPADLGDVSATILEGA